MINKTFEICGLEVRPGVTVEAAENSPSLTEEESKKENLRIFKSNDAVNFIGGNFDAKFVFSGNTLKHVLLMPTKDEIEKTGAKTDTQHARWSYCKGLMENAWGNPLFTDKITVFYSFAQAEAFCAMILDGSEYAGGRIVLQTRKAA